MAYHSRIHSHTHSGIKKIGHCNINTYSYTYITISLLNYIYNQSIDCKYNLT